MTSFQSGSKPARDEALKSVIFTYPQLEGKKKTQQVIYNNRNQRKGEATHLRRMRGEEVAGGGVIDKSKKGKGRK